MPGHRAQRILVGGPHHGGEEAECIRPAAVEQAAALHLAGQQLGMVGEGGGGAAEGLTREGKLVFVCLLYTSPSPRD